MIDQVATVIRNDELAASYRRIVFRVPQLAAEAVPGQFVHVRIPTLRDRILRRPFSISAADPAEGTLTIVYKVVGLGTAEMASLPAGAECPVLGPCGKGYTLLPDVTPILVTGGYGSASTLVLAQRAARKGLVLMGARTKSDLILREDYQALGFDLRYATNDGSAGHKGFVTELLDDALQGAVNPVIYGCGPRPMLYALGKLMLERGIRTELSLDQHMCCGVGACFACVIKVKDPSSPDGFRYSRTCSEGPVYDAKEVWYD